MKKNLILFQALTSLLASFPDMKFDDGTSDSSGEPIKVVRLPWYKVMRMEQEADGKAEERLNNQLVLNVGIQKVISLLTRHPLISIVRKTKEAGKSDLYILCYFGWWYVGIKTTLINT